MIENVDIYLSTIIELLKNKEYNKAKQRLDIAINDMITLDFNNRQDCIRKINVQISILKKIKTSTLSAIDRLPKELRFHAQESLRDTIGSFERKILDYQRQKNKFARPPYKAQ